MQGVGTSNPCVVQGATVCTDTCYCAKSFKQNRIAEDRKVSLEYEHDLQKERTDWCDVD